MAQETTQLVWHRELCLCPCRATGALCLGNSTFSAHLHADAKQKVQQCCVLVQRNIGLLQIEGASSSSWPTSVPKREWSSDALIPFLFYGFLAFIK